MECVVGGSSLLQRKKGHFCCFRKKFVREGMLRRRSIGMSSKQAFKADNGSAEKQIKPTSSFFGSPRFFAGFSVKSCSETESSVIMSPTSTLDSKSYANPFWSDKTTASSLSPEPCLETNKQHHPFEEKKKKRVGLAMVDALSSDEETNKNLSKPETRMVVFGSHLNIQIPSLPSSRSPKSPADFGIKTRSSLPLSPCSAKKSPSVETTVLLASEMELSEDYTCVISRGGPNPPKTTHIFGDCIVEDCCGVMVLSDSNKETCFSVDASHYSSQTYLSFCYDCNKKIVQGHDIYMHGGEKAFCSGECRFKEMSFDEGTQKPK